MSKSRGNFYSGDQLLDEKGYAPDQIRYYLALLGLSEKPSDFDFVKLDERNRFLAGPLNAAFERPISAAHSKFDGRVPDGVLVDGVLEGHRADGPALREVHGPRRLPEHAVRGGKLRAASSTACSRSTSRTTTDTRRRRGATRSSARSTC